MLYRHMYIMHYISTYIYIHCALYTWHIHYYIHAYVYVCICICVFDLCWVLKTTLWGVWGCVLSSYSKNGMSGFTWPPKEKPRVEQACCISDMGFCQRTSGWCSCLHGILMHYHKYMKQLTLKLGRGDMGQSKSLMCIHSSDQASCAPMQTVPA